MREQVSVNQIVVSGLLDDAICRETLKKEKVVNATLILTDRFRDAKPQRQWIHVVAWRGLAVRMAEMPKGAQERISGRLETSSWKDRETGEWKHRLQIVCDKCEPILHLQMPPKQEDICQRPIGDEDIPF